MHEMREEWRIKDPYQRRKAWSRPKSKWGRWKGWVRSVWERNERVSIERDRWEMKKIALTLYIDKYTARWIDRCREVSRIKNSQMELSRGVHSKVTLMDREAIKHLLSIQKLPRWIEKFSRSYRDWFSKTLMDRNCDNSYRERNLKRLDR